MARRYRVTNTLISMIRLGNWKHMQARHDPKWGRGGQISRALALGTRWEVSFHKSVFFSVSREFSDGRHGNRFEPGENGVRASTLGAASVGGGRLAVSR
jgi:hypothetical protein